MSFDQEIVDFAAAVMVRHFHTGVALSPAPDRMEASRDRNILLGYWAISNPVRSFVDYLRRHPHELETALSSRLVVTDAIVRGRMDARGTWMHRARTGNDAAILSHAPERIADLELNRLVVWLLRTASAYRLEMLGWQGPSSPYHSTLEDAARELAAVTRAGATATALRGVKVTARPSGAALRSAARSRRTIYRLSLNAYRLFASIEAGQSQAIETVLKDAVIGPLEAWRRWELAVGLALGETLAHASSAPLRLRVLAGSSRAPIVSAGDFDIYWQQRTTFAHPYTLEPTEERTAAALRDYGIGSSSDRPDLVVVDRASNSVVALVEVKYSAGESAQDRFREAIAQVVRYSRGYGSAVEQESLVARSLVALSAGAPHRRTVTAPAPRAIDWADLKQPQALDRWAQALLRLRLSRSAA